MNDGRGKHSFNLLVALNQMAGFLPVIDWQ